VGKPRKKRVSLTPNRQAAVAVQYGQLMATKDSKARRKAHDALCKKFDVNSRYLGRVSKGLITKARLPDKRKARQTSPRRSLPPTARFSRT
jgi:hypothetical protein